MLSSVWHSWLRWLGRLGKMNDMEVSQQVQQMVQFIRQEAEEKANEISVSAEEVRPSGSLNPPGTFANVFIGEFICFGEFGPRIDVVLDVFATDFRN